MMRIKDIAVKRYIQRMVTIYPVLQGELTLEVHDGRRRDRIAQICHAIDIVYDSADTETQQLIRLRYWLGEVNLTGAGLRLHLTQDQVYRRINKFLHDVAKELGEI